MCVDPHACARASSSTEQDIQLSIWVILACGVGGAFFMGFTVLLLIRVFARCVVWSTILGALIIALGITIYAL